MQLLRIASLMLIMIVFLPVSAFADGTHEDPQTTAGEADSANDESAMKSFVRHAKQHLVDATGESGASVTVFYRQMRDQESIWNNGSVYLIALSRDGGVINHGKYTKSLYGDSLAELPVVKKLLGQLGQDVQAEPVCTSYQLDGSTRWSCAVLYKPAIALVPQVLIGGFDHAPDDAAIVKAKCPEFKPEVTALDVSESQYVSESHGRETLQKFVKGAIQRFNEQVQQSAGSARLLLNVVTCFTREPWNSGPIYLFAMSKLPKGAPVVTFNANNPELTGSPFENVFDEDGVDIGKEILETAGEDGKGGFVEYKWDNPVIDEDDVNELGKSPGRSPKISYVEGFSFSRVGIETVVIFGSGIYGTLEEGSDGDDDGCAIAGTGSKSSGAVFNLFLIVFSLSLAFWWKDRSKK